MKNLQIFSYPISSYEQVQFYFDVDYFKYFQNAYEEKRKVFYSDIQKSVEKTSS